jgi:uncharacterized protein
MGNARKPIIGVIYEGKDISSDLTYFLRSFRYRDKLDSDSPDIEMELEDRENLWQYEWFPETGDSVSVSFQYEDEEEILEANGFEIDLLEFTFDEGGDIFRLGAQQTPFSKNLREKRSQEYENMTLVQVIQTIARRQGLTARGKVYEITFDRLTQNEESDLEFLTRLSDDYGQIFKIEGNNLIFYNRLELNTLSPRFHLERTDITRLEAKKKLTGMYNSAQVVYEGVNGETIVGAIIKAKPPNNSQDVLIINEKVESGFQAVAKAQEKLRKANADEFSGTLELEGECQYIAGVNFSINGFGQFNGIWQIQDVEHEFSPSSGWKSFLTVYKIVL